MDPRTAAEHLAVVEGAPALNRGAPVREVLLGLGAVVVLFLLLFVPSAVGAGQVVGGGSAVGAVGLVLWWVWYHSGRPRRRPQSRAEKAFGFLAGCLMGGALANLVWGGPDNTVGILVPATVPPVCLLVFLVLRWRA
ncbi:hypothetical protein [Streptomyces lasiicapitis]|uniref:hypothetical protein n=1 Tax=Streptomyces lasiicapitis TaxID=1923961 RepID=UPI00365CF420